MLALVMQMEKQTDDTYTQLDRLLDQWADWMRDYQPVKGMPGSAAFARLSGSNMTMATATELLEASVMPWEVQTVDACVDDLPTELRLMIHCEHLGMTPAVFRYRRIPIDKAGYDAKYQDARLELERRLKRKGCL